MKGMVCATRAKFTGIGGTEQDKKFAKRLTIGKTYTIYRIDIEDWQTRIYLKGHPDDYNSVMFDYVDWI